MCACKPGAIMFQVPHASLILDDVSSLIRFFLSSSMGCTSCLWQFAASPVTSDIRRLQSVKACALVWVVSTARFAFSHSAFHTLLQHYRTMR